MSEKKRKRVHDGSELQTRKKASPERPSESVEVSLIEPGDEWTPILVSTPGLSLAPSVAFQSYVKQRPSTAQSSQSTSEVLLHSSAHPKLDYAAREEASNASDNHLKHYAGVYDPERGNLKLVQVRKIVVRSTLRSAQASGVETSDSERNTPNPLSARNTLGLAFGTKKSQKAIRSLTANAIAPSPAKVSNDSSSQYKTHLDPLAQAVISSMAASTSSMPSRDEMQAQIDEGKPRPKPNLAAELPENVYPVESLVGGEHVLRNIAVKEWVDKVTAGEDVQTRSMFVARRIRMIVEAGDVKRIRILRYLLLLVEWSRVLKQGGKGSKRVPKMEEMGTLEETWGTDTILAVGRRFASHNDLNKWHQDNLTTHILALCLTLDNFSSDTHDIRVDLKLENRDVTKYYAELGAVVAPPTEAERHRMGITKTEAGGHRIARLKIPLVFPKMRIAGRGGRR